MRFYTILILLLALSIRGNAQKKDALNFSSGSGHLSVGAFAGPSLMIEKAPDSLIPELQNYLNKLRSGWHYGFESEYFFNTYLGAGVKFSSFNTQKEVDSIAIQFFSNILYVNLSSKLTIHALSPMVYGQLPLVNKKLMLTGGLGPTWLFYRNIGKSSSDSAVLKGSSPGLSAMLRISYEIIPNLGIDLQGNYIHAFLKEFTQDDGTGQQVIKLDKANYQNISRFDFSFGVFYTFRRK